MCVSTNRGDGETPGSRLRGVPRLHLNRLPRRRGTEFGRCAWTSPSTFSLRHGRAVPPLMKLQELGARACREPAHDPDFGVGDFCLLLDKATPMRYLRRLRSVAAASKW